MVAAAAAAAVVAKNVRLFIVTSLEVFSNLVNADHDSELPVGFVTRGPSFGCSEPWHKTELHDLKVVATNRVAE
jgi:hypothetical protein